MVLDAYYPVGKIAEKAVCRTEFLTIWHCIFSAEFNKNALLQIVKLLNRS